MTFQGEGKTKAMVQVRQATATATSSMATSRSAVLVMDRGVARICGCKHIWMLLAPFICRLRSNTYRPATSCYFFFRVHYLTSFSHATPLKTPSPEAKNFVKLSDCEQSCPPCHAFLSRETLRP